jgi:hypothetical protein
VGREFLECQLLVGKLVELMKMATNKKSESKDRLSGSIRALIGTAIVTGAGTLALRLPDVTSWTRGDVLAFISIAMATVLGEQFTLQFRQRDETKNISLTDALFAGALVLAKPSVLTMAVALGVVVGHGMRGWRAYKVAFNVGSFLASITAAELVYGAFNSSNPTRVSTWLAAAAGMAAFFVVNSSSVILVIARAEGRTFMSVFAPIFGVEAVHSAANMAIGIAGAVMWSTGNAAAPFLALLPVASFFAYDAWLRHATRRHTELVRVA